MGILPAQRALEGIHRGQACFLVGLSLKAPLRHSERASNALALIGDERALEHGELLRIGPGKPLLYLGDRHAHESLL